MKEYTISYQDTICANNKSEAYKTFQKVIAEMDDEGLEYCANIINIQDITKEGE